MELYNIVKNSGKGILDSYKSIGALYNKIPNKRNLLLVPILALGLNTTVSHAKVQLTPHERPVVEYNQSLRDILESDSTHVKYISNNEIKKVDNKYWVLPIEMMYEIKNEEHETINVIYDTMDFISTQDRVKKILNEIKENKEFKIQIYINKFSEKYDQMTILFESGKFHLVLTDKR